MTLSQEAVLINKALGKKMQGNKTLKMSGRRDSRVILRCLQQETVRGTLGVFDISSIIIFCQLLLI